MGPLRAEVVHVARRTDKMKLHWLLSRVCERVRKMGSLDKAYWQAVHSGQKVLATPLGSL